MNMYNIDSTERTAQEWNDEAKAAEVITSDFIPVNMWMIKYLGLDATLFLSAAYEEFLYLRTKNKTYYKNSLIFSRRKAQQKTGLGEDRQKKAIETLSKQGLLYCRVEDGIPKKRVITFSFNSFHVFKNRLDQFIKSEIETTKNNREKFNDKMQHIRKAACEAHEQAYKLEWEAKHPGQNYDDYIANLPF